MINYTNESIAEETTTNTLDWLKTLNDEGMDMNPIVYFFDEQDIPLLMVHLPEQDDDQQSKMLTHFITTPFLSLLPIHAVSVCQDVWFTKADANNENAPQTMQEVLDDENYVRPSESINREQGLMTIVIDKAKAGIWNMLEYGRDDKGNIFTKDQNRTVVENWEDNNMDSWIVPMMTSGFDRDITEMMDFSKEEELMALLQAFSSLTEMNYRLGFRPDMADVITKHYESIMDDDKSEMLKRLFLDGEDNNG